MTFVVLVNTPGINGSVIENQGEVTADGLDPVPSNFVSYQVIAFPVLKYRKERDPRPTAHRSAG